MDRILQHLTLISTELTVEDLALHQEQLSIIAQYLRAIGMMTQMTTPGSGPATTLLDAASILESSALLLEPAIVRDSMVSQARRSLCVVNAKSNARRPDHTFSKPHWSLLQILAEGAAGVVRSDQARLALRRVIRLAQRKVDGLSRPTKRGPLVIVGDGQVREDALKIE